MAAMEFSIFGQLPAEIRSIIWRVGLPEQQRKVPLLIDSEDLRERNRGVFRPTSSPPLLQVNQESRQIALKHYDHRPGNFFSIAPHINLEADTIFTMATDVELVRFLRMPYVKDLDLPDFNGLVLSSLSRNGCEYHRFSRSCGCYNYLNVSLAGIERIERLSIGILVQDRWKIGDPWQPKNMSYIASLGRYFPAVKYLTIEIVGTDPAWKGTHHTELVESDIESIRSAVEQQLTVTDAHKESGIKTWGQPHFTILDVEKGKLYQWMTCHNQSTWKFEKAEIMRAGKHSCQQGHEHELPHRLDQDNHVNTSLAPNINSLSSINPRLKNPASVQLAVYYFSNLPI
ncbi:hypothetical protein DL98DRAFT_530388 [Cadophora sp. DSE1049]|nr:hypothetical protein DL98DRAFT_530388 [Cadophora sp. DSE1049]